jgi:VanZ family protein
MAWNMLLVPVPSNCAMTTQTNRLLRLLYYWLPPLIWLALIFLASSQPGTTYPDLGSLDFLAKKLAHFLIYAVLYILLFRAFATLQWVGQVTHSSHLFPMLIAILYAISDEVHQAFVPSRDGAIRDVCIDSFGVFAGYLVIRWRARH